MTKKHFEAIAAIISGTYTDETAGERVAHDIALDLATYFEQENPRFDRATFLLACGVTP